MTGFRLHRVCAASLFLLGGWLSAVRGALGAYENHHHHGWCEHRRIRGSPNNEPTRTSSHIRGPFSSPFQWKSLGLAASAIPSSGHPPDTSSPPTRSKIPPPPPLSLPVWSLAVPTSKVAGKKDAATEDPDSNAPRMMTTTPTSMNIVTYAMAASVAPPKLWVLSLYHGTRTKDAFDDVGWGVLQLLRPCHAPLVEVLGKRSSYDPQVDKAAECASRGCDWIPGDPWEGSGGGSSTGPPWTDPGTGGTPLLFHLLPGCAAYVRVRYSGHEIPAGDHAVVLCEVTGTAHWDDALGAVVMDDANGEAGLPGALDDSTVLYTGALRRDGLF